MSKTHKHAALIKAWADGEEIEFKSEYDGWSHRPTPCWSPDEEYRINPTSNSRKAQIAKMTATVNKLQIDLDNMRASLTKALKQIGEK